MESLVNGKLRETARERQVSVCQKHSDQARSVHAAFVRTTNNSEQFSDSISSQLCWVPMPVPMWGSHLAMWPCEPWIDSNTNYLMRVFT